MSRHTFVLLNLWWHGNGCSTPIPSSEMAAQQWAEFFLFTFIDNSNPVDISPASDTKQKKRISFAPLRCWLQFDSPFASHSNYNAFLTFFSLHFCCCRRCWLVGLQCLEHRRSKHIYQTHPLTQTQKYPRNSKFVDNTKTVSVKVAG